MKSKKLYSLVGLVFAFALCGTHSVLAADSTATPFKPKKAKNFYNFSVRAEKNPGAAKYNGITEKAPLCAPDLLITNSTGQRVGIDPATGNEVREIPRSSYLRDGKATKPDAVTAYLSFPELGDYQVVARSKKQCGYHLEFEALGFPPAKPSTRFEAGILAPGTTVQYQVTLKKTSAGPDMDLKRLGD
jgi:hypothetical protein